MIRQRIARVCAASTVMILLGLALPSAQGPTMQWEAPVQAGTRVEVQGGTSWVAASNGFDFDVVAGPFDVGGVVKDAPYSAEAVTEVVQTLADGNRIVRSNTASFFRDSAGRTRREQDVTVIGALIGGSGQSRHVTINDPEARVIYFLDTEARTARRLEAPRLDLIRPRSAGAPPPPPPPLPPGADGVRMEFAPAIGASIASFSRREGPEMGTPRVETLGTQTIQGVRAEGTRTIVTIEPGKIGNERAIEIVSERWYSPELKTLVLSRQSDPRYGDTTFKLQNIAQGEPDAALFQVPSDFKIESEAPGLMKRRQPPPQ